MKPAGNLAFVVSSAACSMSRRRFLDSTLWMARRSHGPMLLSVEADNRVLVFTVGERVNVRHRSDRAGAFHTDKTLSLS